MEGGGGGGGGGRGRERKKKGMGERGGEMHRKSNEPRKRERQIEMRRKECI